MTQHIPIPTYPQSPAALLITLVDREMARLLCPTVQQALADDKAGDAHLAYATAMAALRAAKAWAEIAKIEDRNYMIVKNGEMKWPKTETENNAILSDVENRLCGERE